MDLETIHILGTVNERFYAEHAESFSATRQHGWPGWDRICDLLWRRWGADDERIRGKRPLRVLDVACGNLRFERFLRRRMPSVSLEVGAIDFCPRLLALGGEDTETVRFLESNIVERLARGRAVIPPEWGTFDVVACFGFFHHVPGARSRELLMRELAAAKATDGVGAVSLWRFADGKATADKVLQVHAQAVGDLVGRGVPLDTEQLEEGDWIMGWRGVPGAWRYCHSFSDAEAESLAAGSGAPLIARFRADGKTGAANEYLVF